MVKDSYFSGHTITEHLALYDSGHMAGEDFILGSIVSGNLELGNELLEFNTSDIWEIGYIRGFNDIMEKINGYAPMMFD